MIRRTSARTSSRPATSRCGRGRTAGTLLALAVVVTAGAPSLITVRPGDTLWDLARSHGTTVGELQRLNGLAGNATIYAGKTLNLPGGTAARAASAPGAGRVHVVVSGDTLSGLGKAYGISAGSITSRNALKSSTIRVGQKLTIPGGAPRDELAGVPTTNAGVVIPEAVRRSVASHRETLKAAKHPGKEQVRKMVGATARQHGVSPSLAVSVAYQESGFQQGVVSGVDAIGVMQVLPSTGRVVAQQHGRTLDLLKTQDNITAGVLLLKQLVRSTGSEDAALAGYYQGLGSISRRGLLPQTHTYIASINRHQSRFPEG
ncbi:MAG: Lytic transglycosylase catalytic [Frankiales bacterium]|jgi:LysM repeat protein|nr:Lytic transglycosylase catalytic [Frankiales bacterium]